MATDFSHLFTGSGEAEQITVTPEYVLEKLSYIDSLDAHLDEGGGFSAANLYDLIGFLRQFAKGYAQHANILKVVIADRERVMGERNAANAELYRLRHPDENEAQEAYERQQQGLMETGGPDDSAYRQQMKDAGRGHLLR